MHEYPRSILARAVEAARTLVPHLVRKYQDPRTNDSTSYYEKGAVDGVVGLVTDAMDRLTVVPDQVVDTGLSLHRLKASGPSQLEDCFRLGVRWAEIYYGTRDMYSLPPNYAPAPFDPAYAEGLQELHDLLFQAQRTDGVLRGHAIDTARLALARLRGDAGRPDTRSRRAEALVLRASLSPMQPHPRVKPAPEYRAQFQPGHSYRRRDGKVVKVISAREPFGPAYRTVDCDDADEIFASLTPEEQTYCERMTLAWRGDTADNPGRKTGLASSDTESPYDLMPGAVSPEEAGK